MSCNENNVTLTKDSFTFEVIDCLCKEDFDDSVISNFEGKQLKFQVRNNLTVSTCR